MNLDKNILTYIIKNSIEEFEPYYLYNSEGIRNHCKLYQDISYENKSIHFATMANINKHFLKIIKEENTKVFVNSIGHLKRVMSVGYIGSEIIFTSSAMTKKVMKYIHKEGVQTYLDSPGQLKIWNELFPETSVGIRCNIGDTITPYSNHAGAFIGKKSRLGFTMDEIDQIEDKNKIKSVHVYVGTDVYDINYFMKCYSVLIEISKKFPNLISLNFGGGFGVSENGGDNFDFYQYNKQLSELMKQVTESSNKNYHLILEPGRIIGADAGFFITYVSDVKQKEESVFVGVNASTAQFTRPLMYPDSAKHPITIIRKGKVLTSQKTKKTTIYGNSTYSRDIFRDNVLLPEIEIGDIIVIGNAGSYSASSYSEFLGFDKPEEYFI